MAEAGRVRLHISPFNATLYDTIVPKSLQPNATGVSYHSVQTFPERGFGYVELPKADADKLRKKLNGATLRGLKMNIQEAKPEKRRRDKEDPKDDAQEKPRKKAKKEKLKKKDKEIAGFELPDNRHVKRGWTEEPGKYNKKDKKDAGKDKKDKSQKREKSKYTTAKEVLFKQKLPEPVILAQKAEGKDKKDKKSKKSKNHVVVHEFEKTKHFPSFLKSDAPAGSSIASEFVLGKGWVDAEGNVVEAIDVKPKREDRIRQIPDTPVEIRIRKPEPQQPAAQSFITAGAKALEKADTNHDNTDESDSDESMSDESESEESENQEEQENEVESEEEEEKEEEVPQVPAISAPTKEDSVPASGSESEESESDSESEAEVAAERIEHKQKDEVAEAESTEAMDIDSAPADRPSTPPREVHPLEALFKRSKPAPNETPRPAPINTSFSFFDTGDDHDEIADAYPQTPFTAHRGIRSAAPTPDTAAIGRKFSFSFGNVDDIEEDEEEEIYDDDANRVPLGVREGEEADEEEETEFAKWFWENRGDTNRAWKKRRRDVLKQKRQRENRRLSRRVI